MITLYPRRIPALLTPSPAAHIPMWCPPAQGATAHDLDLAASRALHALHQNLPITETLHRQAHGVLIFPNMVKAGPVFGGSYGEGELICGNRVASYHNSLASTWALSSSDHSYGYALFLMSEHALMAIEEQLSWDVGSGPSVLVVDGPTANALSSGGHQSRQDEVYAFVFDRCGLMDGAHMEGVRISRIWH